MSDQEKKEIFSKIENRGTEIRNSFHLHEKDEMASYVNTFYSGCLNQFQNDKFLFPKIQLEYFYCLNYFGQYYDSLQTFENLIKEYDKPEIKNNLFAKHPVDSKLIYSQTYIMYYNLLWSIAFEKDPSGKVVNRKEFNQPIMKAKAKSSLLYSEYLSNEGLLTQVQLVQCLENLGFCYSMLSRWYEALYYIGIAESIDPKNVNLHYAKQATLDRVQNATCNTFTKQLVLSILESLNELERANYPEKAKQQFAELKKNNEEILKTNKASIESIIEHRRKGVIQYSKRTNYLKFCSDNKLFLCEHSLHCNCNRGIQDKITIRSTHPHTHIDFLIPFQQVLESVALDYILARKNYYSSLEDQIINGYQTRFTKIENIDFSLKVALLKDSFRLCYSILDTIAIAILEALEIDYLTIRRGAGINTNIHFTNIWDDLITVEHFEKNFYVQALHSISEDINTKVGGHKEFRSIRNAMEHKIFHVKNAGKFDNQTVFKPANYFEIDYQELSKKTLVLLVYTKSLIHTYTYFMRRVSLTKAKVEDTH